MTEKHTHDDPATLSARDATGAKPVKGMPYVLGLSTAAAAILLLVTFLIFK